MPVLPSTLDAEISIVLVGNFNPAIFHPEWFLRQNLLAEVETENAAVKFVSGNVTDVSFLDFGLQVVMNRLVVKTSDATKTPKICDLVYGLLVKLPHTPITAIGLNHTFHLPLDNIDTWHRIGHTLAPKELVWNDLYQTPGMTSVGIQSPRKGDFAGVINILVQPSGKFPHSIFISSNHEFQPKPEESALQARGFIQEAAGYAFKEGNRVAEEIFRKIVWQLPS